MTRFRPPLLVLVTALLVTQAAAQVPGVSREQMWPAPSAADWKKPVLITWQRTWEDALAVSRETNLPILVCTNMDGEIASEHYAGIRYRSPEITVLYEPYVCVIASVYRHNPRDYDEQGRRILCPRFGCVTCGEHIAIEPILYEKFFDGRRIAPRHVMVELDGSETYDVYYAFDTDSVFKAIADGIANRTVEVKPITRGDRSIVERVASRDIRDREAVEKAYLDGDEAQRRRLLAAALRQGDAAQIDLERLAVFGLDVDLGKMARESLAKTESPYATDLISEALQLPMDQEERTNLISTLERLGAKSPKARSLAVVHRGLASRSEAIDTEKWTRALSAAVPSDTPAVGRYELESKLDRVADAAKEEPEDAATRLELSEASLALAVDPANARALDEERTPEAKFARLMFEDARRAALRAEALGAKGWRVDAVLAIASHYLGNPEEAHRRAAAAVVDIPEGEQGWNAMAVLGLFAEARMQAISKAVRAKEEWSGQWLTDVHAAYSVILEHPHATDGHVVAYYDFLDALGGKGQAGRALTAGLKRYPDSWALHARLRRNTLRQKGIEGLRQVYDDWLLRPDAPPGLEEYAGYAAIVAAEFHRRRGRDAQAIDDYDRAIELYDALAEEYPDRQKAADHFAALALAGKARLAMESGNLESAATGIIASFERSPRSAATLDGLNLSPVDTAKMVLARALEAENKALAESLQGALDSLDPEMLRLPAYERETRRGGRRGRRGR